MSNNIKIKRDGLRSTVYGLRSTVYGLRSTVYGLRSTVYGLRSTKYNGRNFFIIALFAIFLTFSACGGGGGGNSDDDGDPGAPSITTITLPDGAIGVAYNETLTATSDTPITWSISSGALPNGLNLDANNGTISGTPSVANTFNFTVKAENSASSNTKALSIVITATPVGPSIATTSLSSGALGAAYSQSLTATGTATITWSIDSGALPAGLNLASNGTISGEPTGDGTFNFTVKATNSASSDTKALSIVITAAPIAPSITTTSLPGGVVGTMYIGQLTATGTATITLSISSGVLPTGLTLVEYNGMTLIYGTPTSVGTFSFTVKATNSAGSDTKAFSIVIAATPVTPTTSPYIITGSGTAFTATKDGATIGTPSQPIQTIIDAIQTHAKGLNCSIQFGNGTDVLDIGTAYVDFNDAGTLRWGNIILLGKISSANTSDTQGTILLQNKNGISIGIECEIANTADSTNARAVYNNSTVTVIIGTSDHNDCTISATTGVAIYNASTGKILIDYGTVSATTGVAIYNNSTGKITVSAESTITSANTDTALGTIYLANSGTDTAVRLEITGGTVENTANNGIAIYNASTGEIIIDYGTVSATTGYAIYNASTGEIIIKWQGTVSATTGVAIYNASTGEIIIDYGTVSATTGYAIYNASTGAISISGGTVSATTGVAIYNNSTGKITVSLVSVITSANTDTALGTIYIANSGTDTAVRLEITGGYVENNNGIAIYNASTGEIIIDNYGMGAVSTSTGRAVYNASTGTVNISGSSSVSASTGYAVYNESSGTVNISDGAVFTTTGYAVYNASDGTVNISGGTVSASTGYAVYSYGVYPSGGKITVSGTAMVTSSGSTIYLGTAWLEITGGTVENTAGDGKAIYNAFNGVVTISDGIVRATTGGYAVYNNSYGGVHISGGTISTTTGFAVYNKSYDGVDISGGTVSATTGYAIYNNSYSKITVSGTAMVTSSGSTIYLAYSDTYTAVRLEITGGTVENTANNGRAIYNASTGAVTISDGTVKATGTGGYAVYNNYTGLLTITEPPAVIIGLIKYP